MKEDNCIDDLLDVMDAVFKNARCDADRVRANHDNKIVLRLMGMKPDALCKKHGHYVDVDNICDMCGAEVSE